MVEVDICERGVGFVLSVGPVSLWLRPAVAVDLWTRSRARSWRSGARREATPRAAGRAASKKYFLTSPPVAATKAGRGAPHVANHLVDLVVLRSRACRRRLQRPLQHRRHRRHGRPRRPGRPGSGGMAGPAGSAASTGSNGATSGTGNVGGSSGVFTCSGGVQQLVITDCGYPYASSNPLTSTVFNESEVLRAIQPSGSWPNGVVSMFYNDEHALTLGVRSVAVKTAGGTTSTDYPVSPLAASPSSVTNPQTGTNILTGDQSGLDASLRPMWPTLFVTDISNDPNTKTGDWQQGGRPISPNAVFGSWKSAVRTVDTTVTPPKVTITPDADPAKNNWSIAGGTHPHRPQERRFRHRGPLERRAGAGPFVSPAGDRPRRRSEQGRRRSGEACVLFCAGGSCRSEGCDTHDRHRRELRLVRRLPGGGGTPCARREPGAAARRGRSVAVSVRNGVRERLLYPTHVLIRRAPTASHTPANHS